MVNGLQKLMWLHGNDKNNQRQHPTAQTIKKKIQRRGQARITDKATRKHNAKISRLRLRHTQIMNTYH